MRFYMNYINRRGHGYGASLRPGTPVHTRGWDAGVKVTAGDVAGRDEFAVWMTSGSHDSKPAVYLGTVQDMPSGPRWVPASPARPDRIPAHVGSPVMDVTAAIPVTAHKNAADNTEFICTVIHRYWPSGEPVFGTVRAYRSDDGTRWLATAGHYDMSQVEAIMDMIERAGHAPRPATCPGIPSWLARLGTPDDWAAHRAKYGCEHSAIPT